MISPDITSAIQQYVLNQSGGAVTDPVNGSYLQAYCEYLGITEPVNASWLQALCNYFGITSPLYGSWVIALANYYGITTPAGYGTWWMALADASGTPPVVSFIWDLNTNNWEAETRLWAIPPVTVAYRFAVADSYGDGWNGNQAEVQREVSPGTWVAYGSFRDADADAGIAGTNTLTMTAGAGPSNIYMDMETGFNYRLVCSVEGSYPAEPEYSVYDQLDVLAASLVPGAPQWVLGTVQVTFTT